MPDAPEVGLAGEKNGELLSLAAKAGFEVFVTVDRGIEYEQNLTRQNIAVFLPTRNQAALPICCHLCPKFFD